MHGRATITVVETILSEPPERLIPFIRDGRIHVMPAKRPVRLLLLDEVAQAFVPGQRYSEASVDAILKTVTDDHATLRRYLVDEELLSRADGTYWRSGGTAAFPADPDLTGQSGYL